MKIAVTGSRDWDDVETVRLAFRGLPHGTHILHGGAHGLDTIAAIEAAHRGLDVTPFPARWKDYGRAAGPIRNRKMLDERPDLVLAFHDFWPTGGGTTDMIAEAIARGIPVVFIRSEPERP